MLSFFRRASNSKIGTWIVGAIGLAILAGFAMADLSNFGTGNIGFGMSSSTLAEVGDQKISEREMSDAMQRRLQQAREQKPDADYASILGDFDGYEGIAFRFKLVGGVVVALDVAMTYSAMIA